MRVRYPGPEFFTVLLCAPYRVLAQSLAPTPQSLILAKYTGTQQAHGVGEEPATADAAHITPAYQVLHAQQQFSRLTSHRDHAVCFRARGSSWLLLYDGFNRLERFPHVFDAIPWVPHLEARIAINTLPRDVILGAGDAPLRGCGPRAGCLHAAVP